MSESAPTTTVASAEQAPEPSTTTTAEQPATTTTTTTSLISPEHTTTPSSLPTEPAPIVPAPTPATAAATTTVAQPPIEEEVKPIESTSSSSETVTITLLALSGSRSTWTLDKAYLARHALNSTVEVPLEMTVYNLKECIWKDWKEAEFDLKPTSAHFIRLIYFGRLLEDRSSLKDCRMQTENPNVVHMTLRPAESGTDDDTRSGKMAAFGGSGVTREGGRTPGCRCVIL